MLRTHPFSIIRISNKTLSFSRPSVNKFYTYTVNTISFSVMFCQSLC